MNENIPKEHYLFEANRDYPQYYVDRNDVKIGDTIIYIANNQLASKKYIVVKTFDKNGNVEKSLQEIEFYPHKNSNDESSILNLHWYSDSGRGGKKKHKKTQHHRKRKQMFKSKSKKMKSKKYRRHQK